MGVVALNAPDSHIRKRTLPPSTFAVLRTSQATSPVKRGKGLVTR